VAVYNSKQAKIKRKTGERQLKEIIILWKGIDNIVQLLLRGDRLAIRGE